MVYQRVSLCAVWASVYTVIVMLAAVMLMNFEFDSRNRHMIDHMCVRRYLAKQKCQDQQTVYEVLNAHAKSIALNRLRKMTFCSLILNKAYWV